MMSSASGLPLTARAQALEELRRKIHSPEGDKGDVEALLGILQQPVEPGQDVRGLAEVLNSILEDPLLAALRGGEGKRVNEVAARALVALGEPHASTLSQRAVAALERERPANRVSVPEEVRGGEGSQGQGGAPARRLFLGGPIAVCCFVLAGYEILFTLSAERGGDGDKVGVLFCTLVTLVAPALVLMLATHRLVYVVAAVLLLAVSVLMSLPLMFFAMGLYAPMWFPVEIFVSRAGLVMALFLAFVMRREER